MIHPLHFEANIVRPCLETLSAFDKRISGDNPTVLMMGTAAQESDLGFYMRQHPSGPGKGAFSVEDRTHDDVWRYLKRPSNEKLRRLVLSMSTYKAKQPPHIELVQNNLYGCAIARIKYWMIPEPLPETLEGLAQYWDKYYNANAEYGTVSEFLAKYNRLVVR